jgi:hypothetical protein
MAKCKDCNSNMVLMGGWATLRPDEEPYENGKKQDVDMAQKDVNIGAHYCESCDEFKEIWEE